MRKDQDLFEEAVYDKNDMKFIREELGISRVKNYCDKKQEKH